MFELNIKDLFQILVKKCWVWMVCMLVFGGATAVWTLYYVTPIYEANTTMYVGKNADEIGLSPTELNIGAAVILDYSEIVKSRLVASTVLEELGFENISPGSLANSINVGQKSNTRVIQISVKSPDPQIATIIANKVAEVFQKKVAEIMQIDNVQIIDEAVMPSYPISPNKRLNMLVGIIIGLFIGVGIIFLIEVLDNTIKTPEDIKKHLNLPVIGTIPAFKADKKGV